jgi:hypothetical protein
MYYLSSTGHRGHLNISSSNQITSSDAIIVGRNRILQLIEEATEATTGGPPGDRLRAAFAWVDFATQWSDPSSLEAYRKSLELLEVVIATGSSLEYRHLRLTSKQLRGSRTLAVDSAAYAIGLGHIEMALEMLEQGRSLLLNQAGRYRIPVEGLEDTLAEKFRAISTKMEISAMSTRLENVNPKPSWRAEDAIAEYV